MTWIEPRRGAWRSRLVGIGLLVGMGAVLGGIGLSQDTPEILINEVELNPDGSDGTRGVEEWVELFNPSEQAVDVGDYQLRTTAGYTTLARPIADFQAEREGTEVEDRVVPAEGFLVLHLDRQQWLDNRNETVTLLDAAETVRDETPELTDVDDNNFTWQRIPNGRDTDTDIDWRFRGQSRGQVND